MTETLFAPRGTAAEIEEGTAFQPKFDADGLIACVVTDAGDGTVLMVGYMNAEALARTIETGEAWFWSRSRKGFWKKGETWVRFWSSTGSSPTVTRTRSC